MMSMLLCGCVCCLSSWSAGEVGFIGKEGKDVERCADGDLTVLWEFFIKDTHSFPYDHALVCSLVKCSMNRQGDNSIVFRLAHASPKT